MQNNYVLINRAEVEQQIRQLQRAIRFCANAQPSDCVPLDAEPTDTYAGSSGYALATMRDLCQSLESNAMLSEFLTK